MIYIGILIGITVTLIAIQITAVVVNVKRESRTIDYNERTLAALERRNEIGVTMNEYLYFISEGLKK